LLLEHPPVFTLGRSASLEHLHIDPVSAGIELYRSGRGGQITYHGPGQLVAYPILQLEESRRDLHRYLRDLEQVVIDLCADLKLEAGRRPGLTGVWVGERKLASLGVRASSWVTSHGLALNYGQDLSGFQGITPCGLQGVEMIGLSQITGSVQRESLEERFCLHFSRIFGRQLKGHPNDFAPS
jgi:lipoate-protein ligase B